MLFEACKVRQAGGLAESPWLITLAPLIRPHEVLKCYKRAQLFAEPDDISNLRKLGDHSLAMQLLDEAAAYWSRLVEIATVSLALLQTLTHSQPKHACV